MADTTKVKITDSQSFHDARYGVDGKYELSTYDDGYGPLWISRNSIGINGIVRARTASDAYSVCEDEFFPEATETIEEIVKEYGFKREHVMVVRTPDGVERDVIYPDDYPNGKLDGVEFVRWETRETPDAEAWADNELFQEAFGFRNNGPNSSDKLNHGIYSKDLNGDSLELLTDELVEALGIVLDIRSEEEEEEREDWQYEVTNGDTVLGFQEWKEHKAEADKFSGEEEKQG